MLGRKRKNDPPAARHDGPPDALAYLWDMFWDVLAGATATGMAPATITWADLAAFAALTGAELEAWEARALIALGNLRAATVTEKPDGGAHQS